ncbi:UspA [Dillenia turbinata]|uniref:UspA n=1 Tax=Dillenia turbinata TaxID=194707 RepID=A0AAN8VY81_9MAGN
MEGRMENVETSAAPQETVQQQEQTPLMMQEGQKKMKVMVAVDESESSMYALKWALDHCLCSPADVADPTSEVELVYIVHVQPPFQNFVYGPAAVFATPMVMDSTRNAQEQNAATILARASQICKDKKVKAETLTLQGDPKDMICQALEEINIDLLVVGSRGLGMIKRAFLGSVSDYCAHHAKCPILIVKPPAKVSSK